MDNWGQRVLAIAMSWAVPCSATLSVVPTIAITLFSSTSGFLAMVSIFLFMFLMMWIVYRVFGKSLAPKEERVGLIMELPPYHKPAFRNILYVTFQRTLDIFLRALRVISLVSIVFFVLTYGFGGSVESSILYKVGVVIDPVTRFFGLKWQAFLAFCASAISKESLLGVLNTLYGAGGSLVSSIFGAKVSAAAAGGISEILAANFTKAEGLAFIFAISFNMPCVSALAAHGKRGPFRSLDGQNRCILHPCVAVDSLYRLPHWSAALLSQPFARLLSFPLQSKKQRCISKKCNLVCRSFSVLNLR